MNTTPAAPMPPPSAPPTAGTIRRRWPIGLILALAVIAAGLAALRLFLKPPENPEPPPPPPAKIENIPVLPNNQSVPAAYSGPALSLPPTLPLYQNSGPPQSLESLANQLAARLSLTAKPGAATLWVSASGTEWLHLDQRNKILSYSNRTNISGQSESIDPAAARRAASEWVSSILNIRDAAVLPDVRYFRGGDGMELLPESDPANATTAEFSFGLTIDGHPVYADNASLPPATVRVNEENTVVSAYITPITLNPTKKESLPTVPTGTLLARLFAGQAVLIRLTPDDAVVPAQHPPTSAAMDRAELVYRLDTSTQLLYPYLQFSGTALLSNSGGSAAIILAVPAADIPTPSQEPLAPP